MTPDFEVIVVGAGPAGASTALELARAGRRVALVDRDPFPRWKVCGCCLGGRAVRRLEALGMGGALAGAGAHAPRRLEISDGTHTASLRPTGTVVVSRTALDTMLAEAAVGAGAEFLQGWTATLDRVDGRTRVVRLRRGGEHVELRARLVIAATGLHPIPVASGVHAPSPQLQEGSRIGVGAVFPAGSVQLPPDTIRMLVGAEGYVGLSVLEDGSVDVAAAVDAEAIRAAGGPGEAVATLARSAGAPLPAGFPLHGWRGTPALTRRVDPPGGERLLIVGDAASYVEPFTGEGMTWALEDAARLVPIVERTLVAGWTSEVPMTWARRRRAARLDRTVIRGVTWLSRGSRRTSLVLRLLALAPWIAHPFVRSASGPPADSTLLRPLKEGSI